MKKSTISWNLVNSVSLVLFAGLWLFYMNNEAMIVVKSSHLNEEMVNIATNADNHPFPWAATAISLSILMSLLSILICLGQNL
jgi:type III secretory pathway component EscU